MWLGQRDQDSGLWNYHKVRADELLDKGWMGLPPDSLPRGKFHLLLSGCKVWNQKANACSKEETLTISLSRALSQKPLDFLAISRSDLPEEILLEPRYNPADPAAPKPLALIVRTSLSGGQKAPSREPIWVYIKVYDKNKQIMKILHRTVDRENGARFDQADLGQAAVSAQVTAFWPGSIEQKQVDGSDRQGVERTVGEIFYMPATATVGKLPRPGHEPAVVELRLQQLPAVIKRIAKFGQPPSGMIRAAKADEQITDKVFKGKFSLWVPIVDRFGNPLPDMQVMLLLYGQNRELLHGQVVRTIIDNNGLSYAVFPPDLFKPEVERARLIACSAVNPQTYVPTITDLDPNRAKFFEYLAGKSNQWAAEFPAVGVNMYRGVRKAPVQKFAKAAGRPEYEHPRRGILNALMLAPGQKPLGGVYAVLNSNGNPSVMAFSDENGLVSMPLLEDGRWSLELQKEYFKLAEGNLTLDPRPGKIHYYSFAQPEEYKNRLRKLFVSLELIRADTGRRLGAATGPVQASAWLKGSKIALGMYDNNGYVNFNNLSVPVSGDDPPVTFKVRLPGYEPVDAALPGGGQDSFINLQIKLSMLNQGRQPQAGKDSGPKPAQLASASEPKLEASTKPEPAASPKAAEQPGLNPPSKPSASKPVASKPAAAKPTAAEAARPVSKPAARLKKAFAGPKGTLTVYANLEGEFKADFDKPIWIYAKVYDQKGRRQAVLGQQADSHGKAVLKYADFGSGAAKAEIIAAWPYSHEVAFSGGSGERDYDSHTQSYYYRPAFKTLTDLDKPGKAPKSVRMRMKAMPDPSRTYDEPGNGILQGQYRVLVPVRDNRGQSVKDVFAMLLLYDRDDNLQHGYVTQTSIGSLNFSHLVFFSDVFNRNVHRAELFLCSKHRPDLYLPKLVKLDHSNPRMFKFNDGYIMCPGAELNTVQIEFLGGAANQAMQYPSKRATYSN